MHIQVTNTNYTWDDDYNISEVRAYYTVKMETGTLIERSNGDIRIPGEVFEENQSVQHMIQLIKDERNKAQNPENTE